MDNHVAALTTQQQVHPGYTPWVPGDGHPELEQELHNVTVSHTISVCTHPRGIDNVLPALERSEVGAMNS